MKKGKIDLQNVIQYFIIVIQSITSLKVHKQSQVCKNQLWIFESDLEEFIFKLKDYLTFREIQIMTIKKLG